MFTHSIHTNTSSHWTQCSLSSFSRHRCVNVFKPQPGTALLHAMTLSLYDYGYRTALCLFAYVKKKKRCCSHKHMHLLSGPARPLQFSFKKKRGRKMEKRTWTRHSTRLVSTTQTQSAQPPSILSISRAIDALAAASSTQYYLLSVARDIEIVVFDGKQRIQFRFSIFTFFSISFF